MDTVIFYSRRIIAALISMAWDTYWPLALGFMLSAFVRAYIPTSSISSKLGKADAKGLSLSALFGAISSSCSYAAASMSRTLIVKGASWSNAIAFMIASTNLVFEIFLVIVTLLGWAFLGGEISGGILFILIGALFTKLMLSKTSIEHAMTHLRQTESNVHKNDPHAHHAHAGMDDSPEKTESSSPHAAMAGMHHHKAKVPSNDHGKRRKWKDIAFFFYMDVYMVGKDILIGIGIAAILSAVVPQHIWKDLFLQNQSAYPPFIVMLWNTIIGMVVALLAFVCSVGNILLAAVLWHGGINFSGVIAFILADLITIPMLMVYRRYYGVKMMWQLLGILSLAILLTSLGVDYIFHWAGWMPASHGGSVAMQTEGIKWNYKTILNLVFIPLSILLFFTGKKEMKNR